jgi:serine/threonine-protein phosphatase 2A regulatory subunit B'
VQEFLELFDSEESVERDYLKNILHKLYAKVSTKSDGLLLFLPDKFLILNLI